MTNQTNNEDNELGNQGVSPSNSFIRQTQMNSRIDDLTELLEAVLRGIQSLKFRHLIIITFLLSLFLGYIGFNWLLASENRSVLINLAGRSKIVGVVSNCPVVKVPFQGETVHVVFINYSNDTDDNRYLASIIGKYDTAKIKPICLSLNKDKDAIKAN